MFQEESIHFIGIGGIGISALAHLALEEGRQVTGSDQRDSALLEDLRGRGAVITIGHEADELRDGVDLVIYTEAVDQETNPELKKARELGIPTLSYFQALGRLTEQKKTIVVAGTHGKTTTTAMLGLALSGAKLDPTVIVGSKVAAFNNRNLRLGHSDLMVAEGCEYRRSFLSLQPEAVLLLNCEAEHLDYYKDEADYIRAYIELVQKIPVHGLLVANMQDANVREVAKHCQGKVIGIEEAMDFDLKVLGDFNQMNATLAYHMATHFGADPALTREALEQFEGTWRRQEWKGQFQGAEVMDDYGHHPTEIRLTLKAIKKKFPGKRLVCVFQPHQYSRTHKLMDEFKSAFADADQVVLTDIYAVRDQQADLEKVTSEGFSQLVSEAHSNVKWGKDLENTYKCLKSTVEAGDIVLTMGAGSIGQLADRLVK